MGTSEVPSGSTLLERRADADAQNASGYTPVLLAAKAGHRAVLQAAFVAGIYFGAQISCASAWLGRPGSGISVRGFERGRSRRASVGDVSAATSRILEYCNYINNFRIIVQQFYKNSCTIMQ